jgi:hypothetical protein
VGTGVVVVVVVVGAAVVGAAVTVVDGTLLEVVGPADEEVVVPWPDDGFVAPCGEVEHDASTSTEKAREIAIRGYLRAFRS